MNLKLYGFYDGMGAATTLIALAIMFLAGFLLSRVSKLFHLPNVTGYILSGILIGPFLLDLVPPDVISGMSFLSDLALGFIAFGVGKFFKKDVLKKSGPRVIVITILEALVAGILVTLAVGALFPDLGWGFALLLGAIATATAPASTLMTINQYDAKGEFVDVLLQVVALDDVVCLLCFSVASAVVEGTSSGNLDALSIFMPILYNLLFLVIGFVSGLFLSLLVKGRSPNSRLIIAVALIALISGGAILLDVSPLLSCMVFGATYVNFTKDEKLFKYVDHFDPPIMLLFFVMSGLNMDFSSFMTIGMIGVVYFLVRMGGKYLGAFAGCALMKTSKKTRNYLGLALAPQAGVAIGLAFLGQRMLPASMGDTFLSIILCSSVLYEMAGPALAKLSLVRSGSIAKEALVTKKNKNLVDEVDKHHISLRRIESIPEHETPQEPTAYAERPLRLENDWRSSRHGQGGYLLARKSQTYDPPHK